MGSISWDVKRLIFYRMSRNVIGIHRLNYWLMEGHLGILVSIRAAFKSLGSGYSLHDDMKFLCGKHTKNYGKSLCLMGKLTMSMAMFNSYV